MNTNHPTTPPAALYFKILLLSFTLTAGQAAIAATYFVAIDGSDANPGSIEKPFSTIQHAQKNAQPGDTVFIRGGTYKMQESQIAKKERIWARVILLDKSGTADKPIKYWAYKDERPIFDFSAVKPAGYRVHAFSVYGSWLHIKGLEVIGVQVTIKGHTQSVCFYNSGSGNIYEQLSMHDGQAIGIYSVRGSDNLFLDCDAYNNYDYTSETGRGSNVDGFGCHPPKGYTGNVFRNCRAWFNSDDGYDCISAFEAVIFENCWAMYNGYSDKFKRLGDGNGFKVGGFGSRSVRQLPNPIPRHTTRFCLAVGNKASGFYANHQIGGADWFNNTAYGNGHNFNMLCRLEDNVTDVPGYGHNLSYNLSYGYRRDPITQINTAKCNLEKNSFELKLTDKHFKSLDKDQLTLPRQPDGNLPKITFMQPIKGSRLTKLGYSAKTDKQDKHDGLRSKGMVLTTIASSASDTLLYPYCHPRMPLSGIHCVYEDCTLSKAKSQTAFFTKI